jgi:hypothetical protein
MIYTIYKHTILKTNKSYIGFTSTTMEKRLHKHLLNAEYGIKTKFYNALRKYSKESISSEILCYSFTEEESINMESFYIKLFDTYKNGYNSTIKGGGGWIIGQLSKEKQESYFKKRSELTKSYKNPNYSGFTDYDIIKAGSELFKNNGYVFNISIWYKFAKENGYPMSFSKCRFDGLGISEFKKRMCQYLGISEFVKYKPTKEHRDKLSTSQKEMCWITNGLESKRIYKYQIDEYDSSWVPGYSFSNKKK